MGLTLFLKGVIISFIIAAPIGPVGILTIRRMLNYGVRLGLASGLGGAAADSFYGAVVGFGLTFISHFLLHYRAPLRLAGGVFLLLYSIRILTKPTDLKRPIGDSDPVKAFTSMFLLTLSNPIFAIAYTTAFAAFGITGGEQGMSDIGYGLTLVAGVFVGSMLWWILLGLVYPYIKKRLGAGIMHIINTLAGVIILIAGVISVISVII